MQGTGQWWFIVLGILMVLMALQTWEVFNFIPSTYLTSKNKKRGYVGALLAGTSYGFVQKFTQNEKYGVFSRALKCVMGGLILLVGLYMFWL